MYGLSNNIASYPLFVNKNKNALARDHTKKRTRIKRDEMYPCEVNSSKPVSNFVAFTAE